MQNRAGSPIQSFVYPIENVSIFAFWASAPLRALHSNLNTYAHSSIHMRRHNSRVFFAAGRLFHPCFAWSTKGRKTSIGKNVVGLSHPLLSTLVFCRTGPGSNHYDQKMIPEVWTSNYHHTMSRLHEKHHITALDSLHVYSRFSKYRYFIGK